MKAVILAGGTGTRLWPMSRDLKPKQFHSFVGSSTMLQQTYERLAFLKPEDIFVATNEQYVPLVRKQLPLLPEANLISEPAMRDTAPCICYSARQLSRMGFDDETMAIIYADHLIQKPENLEKALRAGEEHIAQTHVFSVIAVRAKYPNPHLGYIRIGQLTSPNVQGFEVYELEKFVEKPSMEGAKQFLGSYKYLWNTGLYMWNVKSVLQAFEKYSPEIFAATGDSDSYLTAPKISIDYALIEKLPRGAIHVVPADLGWNDIGNWAALHEELTVHDAENVAQGEHLSIDTEGSLVLANSGKLVVTYGLKNIIIIDTPEALLVMPKEKAGEVKKVIEALKERKKGELL